MAGTIRKSRVRRVPLSEIKDDLSRFLREAGKQEIVITQHGKPAGVLIGFVSDDDWFDYLLENDPRFLRQIERAANWQEARERFRQLHRLVHEDVTVLPLWQTLDHYAYRKSLQGLAATRVTLYQNVEQWQPTPQLARSGP